MTLKLFYAPGACSAAPHVCFEEAGAEVEYVRLDMTKGEQRAPEYLALNPKGRVPLVVTERGPLSECPAILDWIARRWPDAGLLPDDPWDASQVLSFNNFLSSTVHITFATVFRPARFAEGDEVAAAMKTKAGESLDQQFALIEEKLATGPWVHGARYTTSDPYLLVMTRWLGRIGHDRGAFPRLMEHAARTLERPAVRRAFAREGIEFV